MIRQLVARYTRIVKATYYKNTMFKITHVPVVESSVKFTFF